MKLLYRGAEADVFRGDWCGQPAVYKLRKPLPYRLPELDKQIRSQRTVHEAQMLHLSKLAGVSTPHLYYLSPPEALLVMEYVDGERLKTLLLEEGLTRERVEALGEEFGRSIARLHAAGIMHGDLTTSNVMVDGDAFSLIDFGLAVHSAEARGPGRGPEADQGDADGRAPRGLQAVHAGAPFGVLLCPRARRGRGPRQGSSPR